MLRNPIFANIHSALTECGISIPYANYSVLSEGAKVNVSDEILVQLFKFIGEKYNTIDFSEIDKSQGDYQNFKYRDLIKKNIDILESIYKDTNTNIYNDYISNLRLLDKHLLDNSKIYQTLVADKNGVITILYTSLVTEILYGIATLISATIRFTSLDNSSEIEVVIDELDNHSKYIYLKNIGKFASALPTIHNLLTESMKVKNAKAKSADGLIGSLSLASIGGLSPILIGAGVIFLCIKLIPLIREVIYLVYCSRVKLTEVIDLQVNLLKTNIESLENKGDSKKLKKVIARQKSVVKTLEATKSVILVKFEKAEPQTKSIIAKENNEIHFDPSTASDEVMI